MVRFNPHPKISTLKINFLDLNPLVSTYKYCQCQFLYNRKLISPTLPHVRFTPCCHLRYKMVKKKLSTGEFCMRWLSTKTADVLEKRNIKMTYRCLCPVWSPFRITSPEARLLFCSEFELLNWWLGWAAVAKGRCQIGAESNCCSWLIRWLLSLE